MMLRNKLKSTSGASIILALLFFLACAMAGAVILAAGTASSGRIAGLKEEEQSYYTVTSAAKLLRDEIKGDVYSKNAIADSSIDPKFIYNQQPGGIFKAILMEHADKVFAHQQDVSQPLPTTETLSVDAPGFESVTAKFTMDEQYNITIVLSDDHYECTLDIPAAISHNKVESTVLDDNNKKFTQKTTTLTWAQGTIYNQ